jgi:hypothetical protein
MFTVVAPFGKLRVTKTLTVSKTLVRLSLPKPYVPFNIDVSYART